MSIQLTDEVKLGPAIVNKVLKTVDAGLCAGLGRQRPGRMCVEAAVCFALGKPHGDSPECVGDAVRALKIWLNDCSWRNRKTRAQGLRRVAVAQLGSNKLNQGHFIGKVMRRFTHELVRPRLIEVLEGTSNILEADKRDLLRLVMGFEDIEISCPIVASELLLQAAREFEGVLSEATMYLYRLSDAFRHYATDLKESRREFSLALDSYFDSDSRRDGKKAEFAELLVQVLKDMKCPGTKYLRLCPLPKKDRHVKARPRRVSA